MLKADKFRLSEQELEVCRNLTKEFGTSYYYATLLFPKSLKHATFALYAFFRVPDEIVDTEDPSSPVAHERLNQFEVEWQRAYEAQSSDSPVLSATAKVFHHFKIPFHYSTDFLKAMKQDAEKSTYSNYQELENYMYGSAAVVGLMMTHVIGFSDKIALKYAKELGEAMQLTNFLRDINEDWQTRQRIYLPLDELARFNLTKQDIANKTYNEDFVNFMKFQIRRARELYAESSKGIPLLSKQGRLAVRTAGLLYGGILQKIEEADYNIWQGRVRTTKLDKIKLFTKALCQKR
jgi:phytoene synthase